MKAVEGEIFRANSTIFYWASRSFPKLVREDVSRLYSFLRVADNYVDDVPQQPAHFYALHAAWKEAEQQTGYDAVPNANDTVDQRVIKHIIGLTRKYQFDPTWLEAFWESMRADLHGPVCRTLDDSLRYVHGSAEVVGLMLCKIMSVPEEAYPAAKLQGRAFQWINFVRDLAEDLALGRSYFPQSDLRKFHLPDLTQQTAEARPEQFVRLMRLQLDRYRDWQRDARAALRFVPPRMRPAIKTAADMYDWTAARIEADPLIVFRCKATPPKAHVLLRGLCNLAFSYA